MQATKNFVIYNASAGSGKTYALVKTFLIKILTAPQPNYYKHLLAITFTNKAVAEMKTRLINTLKDFHQEHTTKNGQQLLNDISLETGLATDKLKQKASLVLKHLLHNYSLLSVETIDHFNHRLIRTFAKDLQIPQNFEVSLDAQELLQKAVDRVIDKAGTEKNLTSFLIGFALDKTTQDKSWDISIDLFKSAKLLLEELHQYYLKHLEDKSLNDFEAFILYLIKQQNNLVKNIIQASQDVINQLNTNNINLSDFNSYVYSFFEKCINQNFPDDFSTKWQQEMGHKPLYKTNANKFSKQNIDSITPIIVNNYFTVKHNAIQLLLFKNILKNITPLATLHLVQKELNTIKEEENLLPIYEFNKLIALEIKNQPAPFIYERLGEKYKHFFIDEFQDTSQLQWQNIIPLIDNALSQQDQNNIQGSLLLVGDAKQSIYRWRGGLPEQFINLYHSQNPFTQVEKQIISLKSNYRSLSTIVNFNHNFFSYCASFFSKEEHQKIYRDGAQQDVIHNEEGYVEISFIEKPEDDSIEPLFGDKIITIIKDLENRNYTKNDICILTRKKKEGVFVSKYLIENNISVISQETLLIKNAQEVKFLIATFKLFFEEQDPLDLLTFLEYLHTTLTIKTPRHQFLAKNITASFSEVLKSLEDYEIYISKKEMYNKNIFQFFEIIIATFPFKSKENGYLTTFMEMVLDYATKQESNIAQFLSFWEIQKEKVSVNTSETQDAVKVMTIHKSKGLEFPVVIYPYAQTEIYREKEPKVWYPFQHENFPYTLINYSNSIEDYGDAGTAIVQEKKALLELDNINLLYVTLTRPVDELYIIAPDENTPEAPKKFNHLLKAFVINNEAFKTNENLFFTGAKTQNNQIKSLKVTTKISYYSNPQWEHQIKISFNNYKEALNKPDATFFGTIFHETMAHITLKEDKKEALKKIKQKYELDKVTFKGLKTALKNVLTAPELDIIFSEDAKIFNEKEVLTYTNIIRPDRLVLFPNKQLIIVDYKTGEQKPSHQNQINEYAMVLKQMGYSVIKKILVYVNHLELSVIKY